jgi:hypothetical protein
MKTLKRGDIVSLAFPGEPATDYRYRISAMAPDNRLTSDRVDLCAVDDNVSFDAKRGIGMPIKFVKLAATIQRLTNKTKSPLGLRSLRKKDKRAAAWLAIDALKEMIRIYGKQKVQDVTIALSQRKPSRPDSLEHRVATSWLP